MLKDDCPEWLSWGILASIGASFGLKSIGQFKGEFWRVIVSSADYPHIETDFEFSVN